MIQESLHIAFIGTGVMGSSMARHLMNAGHSLAVSNRTRRKAEPLLAAGAQWHDSAGSAAADADVVFTMLGYPADVETSYLAPGGIVERGRPGSLLIDATTSTPELAVRIAEAATARGLAALDAPVSGGDIGAREARLVIMVGGAEAAFSRAEPLLGLLGRTIRLMGGPGAGQHCKMANQIAVAVGMAAWAEALAYARGAGLDPAAVLETIGGGAAGSWALTNLAPRALAGDFAPGFYVKHLQKDIRIAADSASAMELDLPALACVAEIYRRVAERGWQECGTQAVYRLYSEAGPEAAR
jgi:3-hydroxyisobutyrate dehydrogenase